MSDSLIAGSEYLRCEILGTARHEMVVTLDDFLRRRSRLAQVMTRQALLQSEGLREACMILFGDQAAEKWQAYFGSPWSEGLEKAADSRVIPLNRSHQDVPSSQ